MNYRLFPYNGTLTTGAAAAMTQGMGLGALGQVDTSRTIVHETKKSTGEVYAGVWIQKPQPCPSGFVKDREISHKRAGWIFCVDRRATMGVSSAPSEPSHDILELEQAAAGAMNAAIMADQPALTPVMRALEPVEQITKSQYKDQLRSLKRDLKLIVAALIVGNAPPAVPPRIPRPPGITPSSTILDLENRIEELLVVEIPFAYKTAGGTNLDPWPRPPGGAIPPPNAPSAFPGEQLSPGAGQPELPFTGGGMTAAEISIREAADRMSFGMAMVSDESGGYITMQEQWIRRELSKAGVFPGGTPGIYSGAVLSAPAASGAFGSGTFGASIGKIPTWAWAAIAVGVAGGAYLLLGRKKGR